ncbi:MAG: hypothetical protein ACFFE8_03205 [Candidatus Heimdallarchaeota archaeon]
MQFSTRASYEAFIQTFNANKVFVWVDEDLATVKDSLFTVKTETLSYGSIQYLDRASLELELPKRTFAILTSCNYVSQN